MTKHVISMSGGKDSTAMRLVAIEKGIEHIAVFADTGNESPMTYEYLEYLEEKTGPIVRVSADFTAAMARKKQTVLTKWIKDGIDPDYCYSVASRLGTTNSNFLDCATIHGCFPSRVAKFCTGELKIKPLEKFIHQFYPERVFSWQGVRADESFARRYRPQLTKMKNNVVSVYPLLGWNVERVWKMLKRHGIKRNQLYDLGFDRVGCFPCVNCSKKELALISELFPERIAELRRWEELVVSLSKKSSATYFPSKNVSKNHPELGKIDAQVLRARTKRFKRID